MTTAVDICSNALIRLGALPIESFTQASDDGGIDRARLCDSLWPGIRRFVLRRPPAWNCATKRIQLAADSTPPIISDFAYQFTLPADNLRIISIDSSYAGPEDWKIESGKLLYNSSPIILRYVWDNEDPGTWDALLVQVAEFAMVAALARPVTGSSVEQERAEERYERFHRMAANANAQESTQDTVGDFPFIAARYTSGAIGTTF